MYLPDRVKIWLTSVNHFLPKFCPKWSTPVDLSVGDIRRQIAAEWLEIALWSQWRAYGSLEWYHRWPPYDLPFPQNRGPKFTAQNQLRDACCHLENMIEDIDKAAVCVLSRMPLRADRCRLSPNYFGPCSTTRIAITGTIQYRGIDTDRGIGDGR